MLHTRFTDLVGCTVPIQLAPMGAVGTPELVVAVAEAGGMGMTALPTAPAEVVAAMLDGIGAQTSKPFGFNVLMPFLDVDVVYTAAARCRYVDFYHGPVDASLVQRVHDAGALAGWQVGSADEARDAAGAGCDLLVVRGIEGGGRMYGRSSLWPLLEAVLDATDVPVLAAGGIATGRGVAAALAAGAAGVRMGTRFVATEESGAHPLYKKAICTAGAGDTVLTDEFRTGWPDEVTSSRVLRDALDAASRRPDDEPVGTMQMGPMVVDVAKLGVPPPVATSDGDVAAMAMYAGESAALIDRVEPAAAVVQRVATQAGQLLARAVAAGDETPVR